MLARALRWIGAAELVIYIIAGVWAVRSGVLSPAGAVLAALGVAAGWRAGIVVASFAISRSVPPGRGGGWATVLRLIGVETLMLLYGYSVVMAFPGLAVRRHVPGSGPSVLLVHGYQCNAGIWSWFAARLASDGYDVHTVTLEPVLGDIETAARALAERIDEIGSERGPIALVAHSMGGLVSRAYLRRYGVGRVDRLITLGTPHHGTVLAALGMGRNARQMRIGSAWLDELGKADGLLGELPGGVVTVYSDDDNLVAPQDTAILPGARVIGLRGESHTAMPRSARILEVVRRELPPAVPAPAVVATGVSRA